MSSNGICPFATPSHSHNFVAFSRVNLYVLLHIIPINVPNPKRVNIKWRRRISAQPQRKSFNIVHAHISLYIPSISNACCRIPLYLWENTPEF